MTEHERWYSLEERKLFLKERYFTSSHNYFFEVKEAKNGSKYIVIDQRKKVDGKFVSSKMRIFEDEMLEFNRILQNLINFSISKIQTQELNHETYNSSELNLSATDLNPAFFAKLAITNDWREFENFVYYLLKLLGIPLIYNFLNNRQAGRADGFFKVGNLSVIYDCTLQRDFDQPKSEQINNYCNCLKQGFIKISEIMTEEFYDQHKQVWIITQNQTRSIKIVNSIEVREISVRDLIEIYHERLTTASSDQSLEMRLRNI